MTADAERRVRNRANLDAIAAEVQSATEAVQRVEVDPTSRTEVREKAKASLGLADAAGAIQRLHDAYMGDDPHRS